MELSIFNIAVADNDGNPRNKDDIISDLQKLYDDYATPTNNEEAEHIKEEKKCIFLMISHLKSL
jgi:hypothetical protein